MRTEVLAADSVGRTFGRRRVLSAATLAVHAGEIATLLGRNGCGKTTLLRIMIGSTAADWGSVRWRGRYVARPRLHTFAAAGLFFLPERGLLSSLLTVGDHFDRLEERFGVDSRAAVAALGVDVFFDRQAVQLSTGERRRVEMALALARSPVCLVADEPFLGIAPRDAERIADALRSLAAAGCAVLATGHEVRLLLDLATSVTWMTGGTTHGLGAPAEALTHHSFRRDYLGPA